MLTQDHCRINPSRSNANQALHHDFQLSRCLRLFNIFHPYDPGTYVGRMLGVWVLDRGLLGRLISLPFLPRLLSRRVRPLPRAVAYRLEPFIASRSYDPEADILPTWTGKLRVHYQVRLSGRPSVLKRDGGVR